MTAAGAVAVALESIVGVTPPSASGTGVAAVGVADFESPGEALIEPELASPQMSSLVTFASAGAFSTTSGVAGGVATIDGVAAGIVGAIALALAAALAAALFSSSFNCLSLSRSSASSVLCRVISFSFLPLMSSRSLTRDLSSPDSCSLLVKASRTRANSAFEAVSPDPPARPPPPGLSAEP